MLKEITIYTDDRGDRNCPSCKAKDESLELSIFPTLTHNRTTLRLSGFCKACGCNFVFKYVLRVDEIEVK